MAGPKAFQFAVDQIHTLNKLGILKVVEVLFIFLPIAFHGIVGVVIWLTSKSNTMAYRYGGNIRYTLQRLTGLIAFAFIITHLWHLHWIIPGATEFDPHSAPASAAEALKAAWTGPVYAVGVLCAVFHLANGIWTFLIVWGITLGPKSQRMSGYACGAIGLAVGLLGIGALTTFKTIDLSASPAPVTTDSHLSGLSDAGNPQS